MTGAGSPAPDVTGAGSPAPAVITGLGAVLALGLGEEALAALLKAAAVAAGAEAGVAAGVETAAGADPAPLERRVQGYDPAPLLGAKGLRSLDGAARLLLGACALALQGAGPDPGREGWDGLGLVVATASAGLSSAAEFYREAVELGPRYVDPGRFPSVMVNAAASQAGMRFGARACLLTLAAAETGGPEAVEVARRLLEAGRARAVLVAAVEEVSPLLPRLREASGEGAVALVLEPGDRARGRGAPVRAEVLGFGAATAGGDSPEELARAGSRAVRQALAESGTGPGEIEAVFCGTAPGHPLAGAERRALEEGLAGSSPRRVEVKRALGEALAAASLAQVAACALALGRGAPRRALGSGGPRRALVHCLGRTGQAAALVMGAIEAR